MQSASVAGAYRFTISPGAETVMHVKAVIYCRQNPAVLGLAPLTSMFWHGENSAANFGDFRPEVHDSDGLMLSTGLMLSRTVIVQWSAAITVAATVFIMLRYRPNPVWLIAIGAAAGMLGWL